MFECLSISESDSDLKEDSGRSSRGIVHDM